MGIVSFILGRSGTGKTSSLRNFPKEELAVINVQGKILPFKGSGKIEQTITDNSDKIIKALEIYSKSYKSIVIDDYQYTMANEFMRRSTERGYDKFTDIGRHAWDIVNKVRELPQDVIVYIMCHTDRDEEGNEKIKTIGKLLDEKICLEGMSTIVLKTNVTDGVYTFLTQNNGKDTVKSPAGMFPSYAIDNDLYYVDRKIRSYYELGESFLTDEEMKDIDEAVKKDDVPFTGGKTTRRGRKKADTDNSTVTENTTTEEVKEDSEGAEPAETPKRTRRRAATTDSVAEREAEREEVAQRNTEAVVNSGLAEAEAEGTDSVDFDKVKTPELENLPRRRRRVAETPEAEAKPQIMTPPAESTEAETAEATPTRRRRRTV